MSQVRAQVANYQVPAHPSGIEMRTQLNQIVLALVTQASGPVAPVQTFPLMFWGDTTAQRLRMRNLTNDAWTDLGPIDDFLADIRTLVTDTAAQKVNRSGDTVTGNLTLQMNLMFQFSTGPMRGFLGSYGDVPHAPNTGFGFVDSHLANWNWQIDNDGTMHLRGTANINGGLNVRGGRLVLRQAGGALQGEIALHSADGTVMFMRGRAGGGGMEWVNNDYNAILASMDNAGWLRLMGELQVGNGSVTIQANGNIVGPLYPQGIHAWVGEQSMNRADRYALCQYSTDVFHLGDIFILNDHTIVPGNPWVMCGLHTSRYGQGIGLRFVQLRNN